MEQRARPGPISEIGGTRRAQDKGKQCDGDSGASVKKKIYIYTSRTYMMTPSSSERRNNVVKEVIGPRVRSWAWASVVIVMIMFI